MKLLPIALAVTSIFFLASNANVMADPAPNPIANLHQVVALDANRDAKIDFKSIHNGSDTFIAREITNDDVANVKNTFVARDGKTYIAITLDELRTLDKNKNGALSAEEFNAAKSPLLTARMLEDSDQVIVERPLTTSVKIIVLPPAGKIAGTGTNWDNNKILVQQVTW